MPNKRQRTCQNTNRPQINYKTVSYIQYNKKRLGNKWGIDTHFGE